MGKYNFAAIRVRHSHTRAPEDTERLFAGLELFGNLGDSYEEYCEFVSKCPIFSPVAFLDYSTGENLGLLQNESCHQLTKVFRDYLSSVWRRNPTALRDRTLQILLGLEKKRIGHKPQDEEENEVEWTLLDCSTPEALAETEKIREKVKANERNRDEENRSRSTLPGFDPLYRRALFRLMHHPETRGYAPGWPQITGDWERGEFTYEPANDFQRAVYRLFRESWRARSCRLCQKLFVARKHPQMFCGGGCSTIARRKRDLDFWKTRGAALRRNKKRRQKGAK
jgi:hypothetical protein